ncbi:MAG: NADH-quinone oxidoreductase subunit NuoK [Candidatus Sumerlaeia bacterium]|nr:NADH-quinone oxidoreductase subunit NuoK [Candidatus Sumerlaeia bacterium]
MYPITLTHYLAAGAFLFAMGVVACIARRNAVGILIGIELILNAANVNLVAFARYWNNLDGEVFAIIVIILAACEAAVALAIIINLFRGFGTVEVDYASKLKE